MEETGFDGSVLKLAKLINEGKTKQIYSICEKPGEVLLRSKDDITANNAAMKDVMQGKAALATSTACAIFKLLNKAGFRTAFVREFSARSFIGRKCRMLPVEWVARRLATGSFLRRNPGVPEGHLFFPTRIETFFKDDEKGDPEMSMEQVIYCALPQNLNVASRQLDYDNMHRITQAVFEVLERAWSQFDCTLVDMKIEFGVDEETGELLIADVIDNDSWRLWPQGDRTQMKDKQVYRDLTSVTPEAMKKVKAGYEWVAEKVQLLLKEPVLRVLIIMGSATDKDHCAKISRGCESFGLKCVTHVASAHKGTDHALSILHQFEGAGGPCAVIAVAGRSNGLGPVLSGNSCCPVINCPPLSADWGVQDVFSSLRLPSGLGCTTVMSPEAASLAAANVFSTLDHAVWSKLRVRRLSNQMKLLQDDFSMQK